VAINQARLATPEHPIVNDVTREMITNNTPANAASRAPFQGVDLSGFFQNQTTARSSYDSLQIGVTRRMEKGLQAFASYTYAKSIDNASGTGGGAGIAGIVNPGSVGDTGTIFGNQLDNDANRGLSDFDQQQSASDSIRGEAQFLNGLERKPTGALPSRCPVAIASAVRAARSVQARTLALQSVLFLHGVNLIRCYQDSRPQRQCRRTDGCD